jgi:hypothetical protein
MNFGMSRKTGSIMTRISPDEKVSAEINQK